LKVALTLTVTNDLTLKDSCDEIRMEIQTENFFGGLISTILLVVMKVLAFIIGNYIVA